MKNATLILSAVVVVVLMIAAGLGGWYGAKGYYMGGLSEPVMVAGPDGRTYPVWPGVGLKITHSEDKSVTGFVGQDRSSQLARAADIASTAANEKYIASAPSQEVTKDMTGAVTANQVGSDMKVEFKNMKPYVAICCAIAGILMIIGGIVAYVWFKQSFQTSMIICAAGAGLILLGVLASEPGMLYAGIGIAGAIGLAVWLYDKYGAHVKGAAVDTIVPAIEYLEKVVLRAASIPDPADATKSKLAVFAVDYDVVPATTTDVTEQTVASLVKAEIAEHIPAGMTQAVKAVVTDAKERLV